MTVLCRACRKEKAFEDFWWEVRRNALEGTVQIIQFQYYWADHNPQFCSRKCLFEHLDEYCKRAETKIQAHPAPNHSRIARI